MIDWPDVLVIDTHRTGNFNDIVHATTSVIIANHDVMLDVIGIGSGEFEGTERAFEGMEDVLESMGCTSEIVRMY